MTDRADDQEQGPPRWVPYTPPPPDGWEWVGYWLRRLSFPAFVLLFAAAVAGVFYWAEQQEQRSSSTATVNVQPSDLGGAGRAGTATKGPARLTVRSSPEGAVVRVNGDSVGTTPLSDQVLEAGAYMVSLQAPDHLRTDTVIVLNGGTEARLRFALRARPGATPTTASGRAQSSSASSETPQPQPRSPRPAPVTAVPEAAEEAPDPPPAYGALYVTSEPLGAVVSVAGTERGRTPLAVGPLSVGAKDVVLSMDGYQPWEAQVEVQADTTHRVQAELARRTGRLRVLARPWGTLYINGTLHARESDVWYETQIPAGVHRVTAVHPALGTRAETVEVQVDEETSVVLDLQQPQETPDDSS